MAEPISTGMMIAAGASATSGFLGFKSNKAQAKALKQIADYEFEVSKQEAKLLAARKVEEESRLRKQSERLVGSQRVAVAKSGTTMEGSNLLAMRDAFFKTEKDALMIQFSSEVEQTRMLADRNLTRAEGRARAKAANIEAYRSLLEGGSKAATMLG
tara:strand:+ start:7885 stop:8355 length:471 start_codon:yes stop_codon:yes gene_type:complete